MRRHVVAWLLWTGAAAGAALLTRNPFYLVIIALSAGLVMLTVSVGSRQAQGWRGLLKVGMLIWLITIPFNALMIHGGRYVLLRLPLSWPLIGGNITLEATLYGAVSGLAVWTLLAVFSAFNLAVDPSQLLRLVPSFLFQVGVVASIALTFVPQLLTSFQEIREAQRVRGHRFRSWRDALPLLMPLLTTSLERAIQLAESLESRGFGGSAAALPRRQQQRLSLLLLAGLALLLSGLVLTTFWRQSPWPGRAFLGAGTALLVGGMLGLGARAHRSRYRRTHWAATDTLVALCSVGALAALLAARWLDVPLGYYPYPPFSLLPAFEPWVGSALMLLALPGLLPLLANRAPAPTGAAPLEDTA